MLHAFVVLMFRAVYMAVARCRVDRAPRLDVWYVRVVRSDRLSSSVSACIQELSVPSADDP